MYSILKKMTFFVMLVTLIISQTGCSASNKTSEASAAQPKPMEVKATVYYSIDKNGNKKYLQSDDPLIAAVSNIISTHSDVTDNRSYKQIDFTPEYALYTDKFLAEIKKGEAQTVKFYKDNEIETKHSGILWYEMLFSESLDACTVKIIDQFTYSKANAGYYSKAKITSTDVISQQRVYSVELQDGQWRIKQIDAGGEVKGSGVNSGKSN